MRAVGKLRGARTISLALVAGLLAFETILVLSAGAVGIPGVVLIAPRRWRRWRRGHARYSRPKAARASSPSYPPLPRHRTKRRWTPPRPQSPGACNWTAATRWPRRHSRSRPLDRDKPEKPGEPQHVAANSTGGGAALGCGRAGAVSGRRSGARAGRPHRCAAGITGCGRRAAGQPPLAAPGQREVGSLGQGGRRPRSRARIAPGRSTISNSGSSRRTS